MWGLDLKTLIEEILVAIATIVMIMSLSHIVGELINKYDKVWFVIGIVLFLYASKIAKKITGG
jgi:hypothetical protein